MKKFTKIVGTISDQRCDVEFIKDLYKAGLNVVRLNTAHMDREGMTRVVNNTRAVSDKIAILIDTKGPEIRTTKCASPIMLKTGDKLVIKGDPAIESTKECICVSYSNFVNDLSVDSQILFDDGEIALRVVSKDENGLHCEALNNGALGSRKSVNVPGARINLPSLTDKDIDCINFAAENDIDFIAHSFVRNREDVLDVQRILDSKNSAAKIIAKIENQEGVENIDEILEHVYGVMVARGDLGIEIPQEKIPGLQRQLIRKCVEAKKPVIVATQMLHSMIKNPRPTRAEVTDVANAIYYRTDAIMLSGETAYGDYAVEAVKTMSKIAREVEPSKDSRNDIPIPMVHHDTTTYLAESAVNAVKELDIKAILTDSATGKTARMLAAFRGTVPVFSLCYTQRVGRELGLSYGVFPKINEEGSSKADILKKTVLKLKKKDFLNDSDLVVYLGGSFGIGGGTTFMEIISVEGLLKKIESYRD
ncbi:MAG: pyruvate kinase [Marinilabiliaceae bacterium]|nr:pyruvate kinase [Marinilabiliaceae bacterium]